MYQKLPIPKRSFLQRLFRQHPEEGALIELNNMLVEQTIKGVSDTDVSLINTKYQLDVRQVFALNLMEYCLVFFADCLKKDGWVSQDNQDALNDMIVLFHVDTGVLKTLQRSLAEPMFKRKMTIALRDGKISEQEEEKLQRLASTAMIPQQVTVQIKDDIISNKWNTYVQGKLRSERLTPDDDRELEETATRLGIQPSIQKESRYQWQHLRRLWDLENLELPALHTMDFHKSIEQCYYSSQRVEWHEERISKGVPYLKHIDTGTLMLTNRQLIFTGKSKVVNLKYQDIQDFIRQDNILEVRKYSGRSPSLSSEDLDALSIVLARLIAGNI